MSFLLLSVFRIDLKTFNSSLRNATPFPTIELSELCGYFKTSFLYACIYNLYLRERIAFFVLFCALMDVMVKLNCCPFLGELTKLRGDLLYYFSWLFVHNVQLNVQQFMLYMYGTLYKLSISLSANIFNLSIFCWIFYGKGSFYLHIEHTV